MKVFNYLMAILYFVAGLLAISGVVHPSLEAVAFVAALAMAHVSWDRAESRS